MKWFVNLLAVFFLGIIFFLALGIFIPWSEANSEEVSRKTLTGEVLEIEYKQTLHGDTVLTVADDVSSVNAKGEEVILTYRRHVYFQEKSDADSVQIGDTITVSGIPNGYSLFSAKIIDK